MSVVMTPEKVARLDESLYDIGLQQRTANSLEQRGIFTLRHLLECEVSSLLEIDNVGEKTLTEIFDCLKDVGFFDGDPATVTATAMAKRAEFRAGHRRIIRSMHDRFGITFEKSSQNRLKSAKRG